jgi:outer membrane biosynthesis protein TonB
MTANWRINRNGQVSSVRVAKTTLNSAKVEGCVLRQIKKWQFPKPDGGEVDVDYPFLFRGGS